MKKVVTDSGNVISGQKEIMSEVRNYYKNLFRSRGADLLDCSINDLNYLTGFKKLFNNDSNLLEGCRTMSEISKALKAMKNQKCPGIDGIPAEFFKVFWAKLNFFVQRSLNCGYNTG